MRLLNYTSGYEPCGVADYNRHLTAELARLDDITTIAYPTRRVPRHRVRDLLAFRREYRHLAAVSDTYDAVVLNFASKYWNGARPIENMLPHFLRRVRRPLVTILHEWPAMPGVNEHSGPRPLRLAKAALTKALLARDLGRHDYREWIEQQLWSRMQSIIVHTPEFQHRLREAGVPADRITLVPFPLHELPPPAWTPAEVASRFGLSGKRALLLLGLPVARKGFDLAVRALQQLPADVVVVLVCSQRTDQERAAVEPLVELARACGVGDRFITTGYLDDAQLASIFPVVSLAVAPFTAVSGSSSIAHFFAAGLPVITTDLPPMRKALEDGAGIALVPPANTDALAKTIADILGSPDEQARMRAASTRYSASHTFAHLARTVHELAKRHA